jgi:hypothetical protein
LSWQFQKLVSTISEPGAFLNAGFGQKPTITIAKCMTAQSWKADICNVLGRWLSELAAFE